MVKVLPQLLQSLILNLHTGMTLENAIALSAKTLSVPETLVTQISVQQSAVAGMTAYAQLVNDDKVWRLIRLLELGQNTGGNHLTYALEKFNQELWAERLALLKKQSEKVSVQLTFLLMLSLISIIVIAIAPILLTL